MRTLGLGLLGFVAAAAGLGAAAAEPLVPARFNVKTDAMGFRWDFASSYGSVNRGSDSCFNGAQVLMVNGDQFSADQSMMTRDGSEYVLTEQTRHLTVIRRIRLDQARSGLRYLEVFRNSGGAPMQVAAMLRTHLGSSCARVVTDTGAPFTGALGRKDAGLLAISRGGRPSVLFLLADRRNKQKPRVVVNRNRELVFHYNFAVKPGETVSILHVLAQRRGGGGKGEAAKLFRPFYRSRLVKPAVSKELLGTVINFRAGGGAGDLPEPGALLAPAMRIIEALDVERCKQDVLVQDADARLTGAVAARGLAVQTPYGRTAVDPGEVALLLGGAGLGRPMRVYLRSGEVLTGSVAAEGLSFRTEAGLALAATPAGVNAIVMRADGRDGLPPAGTAALLETRFGARLALAAEPAIEIEAVTPWGRLRLALDQIERLAYVREPQPGYRLHLTDGSRILVFLRGNEIAARTLRFGPIRLPPAEVASLVRVRSPAVRAPEADAEGMAGILEKLEKKVSVAFADTPLEEVLRHLEQTTGVPLRIDAGAFPEGRGPKQPVTLTLQDVPARVALRSVLWVAFLDCTFKEGVLVVVPAQGRPVARPGGGDGEPGTDGPCCELVGENLLAGRVDLEALEIVTPAGPSSLEMKHLRSMERGDEAEAGLTPVFVFELAGGRTVTGTLKATTLPIRSGERVWRVPVQHLVSVRMPEEPEPEEEEPGEEAEGAGGAEGAGEVEVEVEEVVR